MKLFGLPKLVPVPPPDVSYFVAMYLSEPESCNPISMKSLFSSDSLNKLLCAVDQVSLLDSSKSINTHHGLLAITAVSNTSGPDKIGYGCVGDIVGAGVGGVVGLFVGLTVGEEVGTSVGLIVGRSVGANVGEFVGGVGDAVGAGVTI